MYKQSIKQRLLRGGAWAFAGKVAAALTGLAVNALLARLLTPEEMGAYFLTLSLVTVATVAAQLGLTQTIVRLVAESMGTDRPGRARQSILLVIRLTAVGAFVVSAIFAFGGGRWVAEKVFHSILMAQVGGLATVWVLALTFQSVLAEVFRGFHDIRLATLFSGLSTTIFAMLMFAVLWRVQGHAYLNQVILLMVIAGLSSVVLSALLLGKRLTALPKSSAKIPLQKVLSIAWPLWLTNLTLFVLSQADLWVLGGFRAQNEVAIYGAATRLLSLVAMSLLVVNAVVQPMIAEMYAQNNKEKLERVLRTTATIAGIPALIVLVFFVVWGNNLLALVFGGFYKSGGSILFILSLGQLANVLAGSCGLTLMLTGHQMTMLAITIVSGVITVTLALFLVGPYGAVGVASSAAFGMVIQNIFMLFSSKRKVGIWTHFSPVYLMRIGKLV